MAENSASYKKLKDKLQKARERLEKMRKRLSSIRKDATHKQVAQVIGIRKGTVDSSLHKLRERLAVLSEKSNLN